MSTVTHRKPAAAVEPAGYSNGTSASSKSVNGSSKPTDSTGHWGRNSNGSWAVTFGAMFVMFCCPLFANIFNDAILYHSGDLTTTLLSYTSSFESPVSIPLAMIDAVRNVDPYAVKIYIAWMLYQIVLTIAMPGPTTHGHPTCAGFTLKYYVNGLNAYIFTHLLALALVYLSIIPATIIADNWRGLFICSNVFGLALTFFAYFKSLVFPSHKADCKFSGSILYDIFMGVEHNPRFTDRFDFKLFFNTRPGMIAWTLIDLSFAAYQYEKLGYVSKEMIAVNIIHTVYVIDLFVNESWYTRTIDIQHDHFGFYLAWGDNVWLPFTYTLQAQYLAVHNISISLPLFVFYMSLFSLGYYIFRSVNTQKDAFRASNGKLKIWGKEATFIRGSYSTIDGQTRESLLLTAGWWGLARHFNYAGDLMICIAVCGVCGWENLLPYFYLIFMTILLLHRIERDHQRCAAKYGKAWEEYERTVPYKLMPYVY